MKLNLTKSYCWFDPMALGTPERVVKMYFINGIPFTWDDLTEEEEEKSSFYTMVADDHKVHYNMEFLFHSSGYLVMEECHPCFFEMELENPEILAELDEY